MTIQSQPLSDFSAKLGGFSDISFDKLGVTELCTLLADARTAISLPTSTPIYKGVKSSNPFSSITPIRTPAADFSSTSKVDRIRCVGSSQGTMTYTGSLDFLDTQPSFDLVFEKNILLYSGFPLGSMSNVQPRTPSISRSNYLVCVTPTSCIFFATSSNSNMLERRHMTGRKCLLSCLLPIIPLR